jgi:predicted PolB exonuclease-like 3'-5' exonuclease
MIVNEVPIPQALNLSGKKPWEVQHIDTMDLWKFGDKKNYMSLDLLTSLFNIDSSKSNIDGSQVNKVYYSDNQGLMEIVNYCQEDVIATAQVYLKLKGLPAVKKENITRVDQ